MLSFQLERDVILRKKKSRRLAPSPHSQHNISVGLGVDAQTAPQLEFVRILVVAEEILWYY